MNEARTSFRTSAFGGFNRRDVVAYIQTAAKEHQEQTAKLKADLEIACAARAAAEEKAASAERVHSVSGTESDRLRQVIADANAERDRLTAELAEKTTRLEAMIAEGVALRNQVAQLEPSAAAYETLKEKAAVIELDAHSRAQQIVSEAERTAAALRTDCDAWLVRVRESYEQLRNNIEATVFHSTSELERTHNALTCAMASFREHDATLTKLGEQQGE